MHPASLLSGVQRSGALELLTFVCLLLARSSWVILASGEAIFKLEGASAPPKTFKFSD